MIFNALKSTAGNAKNLKDLLTTIRIRSVSVQSVDLKRRSNRHLLRFECCRDAYTEIQPNLNVAYARGYCLAVVPMVLAHFKSYAERLPRPVHLCRRRNFIGQTTG
jgi:hypothetical protein